jgi:hypothetical protein
MVGTAVVFSLYVSNRLVKIKIKYGLVLAMVSVYTCEVYGMKFNFIIIFDVNVFLLQLCEVSLF